MGFDELIVGAFKFLLFMCGTLFVLLVLVGSSVDRDGPGKKKGPPDETPPPKNG